MIQINKNKDNCCGCNGCVQICPKRCISLKEDAEGFVYPEVDINLCINCNLCEKVCPVINSTDSNDETLPSPKIYGVKNKDIQTCIASSSGGVFKALADRFIDEGGVVFGAVFTPYFQVAHTSASTMEELIPMMKSKYVQSEIGTCFSQAESLLKLGKKVLFTGTPCQVAGLKLYLRKDYPSLFTVEVICHGVPSPGIWRKYLNEICGGTTERIAEVNFREKNCGNWFDSVFSVKGDANGKKTETIVSMPTGDNPFIRAFTSNVCLRPICYDCSHKNGKSGADLTIGDFWGINELAPAFYDKRGVSLVVVHSSKGERLLENDGLDKQDFTACNATSLNKAYSESAIKPFLRKRFFKVVTSDNNSVEAAVKKVLPLPSELSCAQKVFHLPYRIIGFISRKLHNR